MSSSNSPRGPFCRECRGPIRERYYDVGDNVMCFWSALGSSRNDSERAKIRVEKLMPEGSKPDTGAKPTAKTAENTSPSNVASTPGAFHEPMCEKNPDQNSKRAARPEQENRRSFDRGSEGNDFPSDQHEREAHPDASEADQE